MLSDWKQNIIAQMRNLLEVKQSNGDRLMRHSSVNYLEVLTAQQTLLTNLQKFFRHLRNTTQNRQSNEAGHQLGWSVSLYICKERAHKDGLHCACVAHIYSPDLYLYPATLRCRVFLFYCLPLQGDAQYPVSTRFVKMTKREAAQYLTNNQISLPGMSCQAKSPVIAGRIEDVLVIIEAQSL